MKNNIQKLGILKYFLYLCNTNQDVTYNKREVIFLFNATINISSFFAIPPSLFFSSSLYF